jgi:hypothetical protein
MAAGRCAIRSAGERRKNTLWIFFPRIAVLTALL